jgi:germination protein M
MRRTTCALLALTLALLGLAGCTSAPAGTSGGSQPGTSTPVATSTAQPSVSPTSPTPTQAPLAVTVYFESHGTVRAAHRSVPAGTRGVLTATLKLLLEGPTAKERAAGLTTQIPAGTKLRSATTAGRVAVIDLTSRFETAGETRALRSRLAQVIFTVTQFQTIAAVEFRINGTSITKFGAQGISLAHPRMRSDYANSLAAIFVESPAWGGTLTEGATIHGSTDLPEAALHVQLKDSNGMVLFKTTVNASSGTGTRDDWAVTATLNHSTAKHGTLKVYSLSATTGEPVDVVTVPVALKP